MKYVGLFAGWAIGMLILFAIAMTTKNEWLQIAAGTWAFFLTVAYIFKLRRVVRNQRIVGDEAP
jgi:hypothetical protein